jgi:transcriptional regulator with XRE-family HTH domain
MTPNDQFLKELGRKIRKARTARRMSLQALSHSCRADYSNLLSIEQGKKNPRILTVVMIAEHLNMDIKDLI